MTARKVRLWVSRNIDETTIRLWLRKPSMLGYFFGGTEIAAVCYGEFHRLFKLCVGPGECKQVDCQIGGISPRIKKKCRLWVTRNDFSGSPFHFWAKRPQSFGTPKFYSAGGMVTSFCPKMVEKLLGLDIKPGERKAVECRMVVVNGAQKG